MGGKAGGGAYTGVAGVGVEDCGTGVVIRRSISAKDCVELGFTGIDDCGVGGTGERAFARSCARLNGGIVGVAACCGGRTNGCGATDTGACGGKAGMGAGGCSAWT